MTEVSRAAGRSPSLSAASGRAAPTRAAAPATEHRDVGHDAGDSLERRGDGSAPTVAPKATANAAAPAGAVKRGLTTTARYDPNPDAAKLFTAMKGGVTGWGTDEKAIADVPRNKTPDQVKALRAAYADRYPGHTLDGDIKSELSGKHLQAAQRVLTAKTARAPAVDVKVPKDMLATLAKATPAERTAIAVAHHTENGRSLGAGPRSRRGRRHIRRAPVARCRPMGAASSAAAIASTLRCCCVAPSTPAPMPVCATLFRARETAEFERGGMGNIVGTALTGLGGNGRVLDASTTRVEAALGSATQPDGTLSSSGAERLRTLLGYQSGDVEAYRQA